MNPTLPKFKGRYYALVTCGEMQDWKPLQGLFCERYWPTLEEARSVVKKHMEIMNAVRTRHPTARAKYIIFKEVRDKLIEEIHE